MSYVYSIPENMFIVMPAAVLFATVFTVGAMGRHSELTAAKAGGLSFHRLMLPVVRGGGARLGARLRGGRAGPGSHGEAAGAAEGPSRHGRPGRRYNFVYRGDQGWVYTIRSLDVATRQLKQLMFEREGDRRSSTRRWSSRPTAPATDDSPGAWRLRNGASRVIAGPGKQAMFAFRTMRLRALTQSPADLLAEPKAPDEMRYAELGRYIDALQPLGQRRQQADRWSGPLKLAIPVTCFIIALFGAPLAVTSRPAPAPRSASRSAWARRCCSC